MPFTSTSPPNSNPFGNQGSPFGALRPAQTPATQIPPAGQYGSFPAAPVYSSGPIDANHHLGRGDHLSFRIQEDRDDKNAELIVSDSGEVNVPYLGLVKAAGKSTNQLTSDIKGALERQFYWPGHATVVMGLESVAPESSLGRVFVSGSVRSQGAVDLPSGTSLTVSQAIIQCGGMTDFADPKHVKVIRKGASVKGITVNVKAVLDGQTDKDMVLQPGDQIKVPENTFNIKF